MANPSTSATPHGTAVFLSLTSPYLANTSPITIIVSPDSCRGQQPAPTRPAKRSRQTGNPCRLRTKPPHPNPASEASPGNRQSNAAAELAIQPNHGGPGGSKTGTANGSGDIDRVPDALVGTQNVASLRLPGRICVGRSNESPPARCVASPSHPHRGDADGNPGQGPRRVPIRPVRRMGGYANALGRGPGADAPGKRHPGRPGPTRRKP